MKRVFSVFLATVLMLSMAGCGGESAKEVDLNALYETLLETTPKMILLDDTMRLNLLGIVEEDCVQVITAVCSDGLRADEIWLIQAKDADALARIASLAEVRLNAKAEESITYSPEQYAVVQKAKMLTEGLYFVLLVSPNVDALKETVEIALK